MDEITPAVDYARHFGMTDRGIAQAVKAAADQNRFAETPDGAVTLEHPDLPGQPIPVHPDAVAEYERGGWKPAPDAALPVEPPPGKTPDEKPAAKTTKAKETP